MRRRSRYSRGARFSERNLCLKRFLNFVSQSRSHVGGDKSWRDRVHGDIAAGQLTDERFCETDQARLARRNSFGLRCRLTRSRADVNNASAALLDHRARDCLHKIERPLQVCVDDHIPLFDRHAHT
jgi:hypothetical protein